MPTVLYEVRDRVAFITLNRPEKLNAIDAEMRRGLFQAFREVKRDPEVWAAIITGVGRAFCTGHDLAADLQEGGDDSTDDLYLYLSELWKPVIAAINGHCMAQGGGIALLCDIRIASEQARFAWPQAKRGIGSVSGPAVFAHCVPLGIALEHLLTGEPISAQEALKWGMVNQVVPHEELMPAAEAMARRILSNAPLAVSSLKEISIRAQGLRLRDRVALARIALDGVFSTQDADEGLKAFQEKRPPVWQGR